MESITVTYGSGKHAVEIQALLCGEDLSVTICGGTHYHVGAVSVAVYEPVRCSATVSTVTVFTHRDDHISAALAKKLSSALKCTVCAAAGLHVDNAAESDLTVLRENAAEACSQLLLRLRERMTQS